MERVHFRTPDGKAESSKSGSHKRDTDLIHLDDGIVDRVVDSQCRVNKPDGGSTSQGPEDQDPQTPGDLYATLWGGSPMWYCNALGCLWCCAATLEAPYFGTIFQTSSGRRQRLTRALDKMVQVQFAPRWLAVRRRVRLQAQREQLDPGSRALGRTGGAELEIASL